MVDLMIQKPSDLLYLSSLEDENLIFSWFRVDMDAFTIELAIFELTFVLIMVIQIDLAITLYLSLYKRTWRY